MPHQEDGGFGDSSDMQDTSALSPMGWENSSPTAEDRLEQTSGLLRVLVMFKVAALALCLIGVVYIWYHLADVSHLMVMGLHHFDDIGFGGILAFLGCYCLCSLLFLPTEPFNVGAGFIFTNKYGFYIGFPFGIAMCISGLMLSCIVAFTLARHVLQKPVREALNHFPHYQAVNRAVLDGGICFIGLLRLSPIVPYTLSNYFFGITRLPLSRLLLGNLACIPATSLFVYLGTCLNSLAEITDNKVTLTPRYIALIVVGLLFGIAAIVYIGVLTRKRLVEAEVAHSQLLSSSLLDAGKLV